MQAGRTLDFGLREDLFIIFLINFLPDSPAQPTSQAES